MMNIPDKSRVFLYEIYSLKTLSIDLMIVKFKSNAKRVAKHVIIPNSIPMEWILNVVSHQALPAQQTL